MPAAIALRLVCDHRSLGLLLVICFFLSHFVLEAVPQLLTRFLQSPAVNVHTVEQQACGTSWCRLQLRDVTVKSWNALPLPRPLCSAETAPSPTPGTSAQGLSSKTPKEGLLPPVPLLLLPATHLQWNAVKTTSRSVWSCARSRGTLAVVALAVSCGALALWAFGDEVAALGDMVAARFPSVVALRSVRGLSAVSTAGSVVLRWASGTAGCLVRLVNPFEGARDALRLHPAKV